MQSIIALAGVVGLAAASYAPVYDSNVRSTISQEAAFATPYAASTVQQAAQVPTYGASTVQQAAQVPTYSVSAARAPVFTQVQNFNSSPIVWSTTKYIRTSAYETYCPEATTLTFNTKTYTITAATTLTVTDCYNGCSVVKPLPTTTIDQSATYITTSLFETYCPEATTLTFSEKTFTITKATTLTIPQTLTTNTIYKTIVPLQPSYYKVNSTIRTTFTVPTPTVQPFVPVTKATVPTVAPFVPGTTQAAPVPTTPIVEPFVPGTSSAVPVPSSPIIEPFVPGTPSSTPVSPVETNPIIEPFVPVNTEQQATVVATTAQLAATVKPYPIPTSETLAYIQPNATATGKIYPSSPVMYTGAATRVGAGALMALAGLVALL